MATLTKIGPIRTLTAGSVFLGDHLARCVAHPGFRDVTVETARTITVRMDQAAWDDFVSDLRHYAGDGGPDDPSARSYVLSARATLRSLVKSGALEE